jgi:hypothetical protein
LLWTFFVEETGIVAFVVLHLLGSGSKMVWSNKSKIGIKKETEGGQQQTLARKSE